MNAITTSIRKRLAAGSMAGLVLMAVYWLLMLAGAACVWLFALLLTTGRAHAAGGSLAAFSRVLDECVEAGAIRIGPGHPFARCSVTSAQWVSTAGLTDFYRAEYCLGSEARPCARRAFNLFANRAYTPIARLVLQRLDPEGTRYEDPQVLKTEHGHVLALVARLPSGAVEQSFHRWDGKAWRPLDSRRWRNVLAQRLPPGHAVRGAPVVDPETLQARAAVYRKGDADCCPSGGMVRVELGITRTAVTLQAVRLLP
jgi:hypothetical protein